MATVDELFETMAVDELDDNLDTMFVIEPVTRMVSVPESEMIFGVESDSQSEKKRFLSPRYVGNNIDLSACFLRVNYRNANGDIDSYLVNDLQIVGNDIVFSWELSRKVTEYKGFVHFVVCAGYANREGNIVNEWNTTVAMGTVLEGIEPTIEGVAETTSEIITQLLATVANQTANVEAVGAAQVTRVEQAAESARIAVEASIEAKGTNTLATIPGDYTELSERVDALDRGRAPGIVCEVEGEKITVNDASDLPLVGLRVFGKSTQRSIPTPEAPMEIEGVENPSIALYGKNLFKTVAPSSKNGGITYVTNNDGSVTINGTAVTESYYIFDTGNVVPVTGKELIASCTGANGLVSMVVGYYKEDGTLVNKIVEVGDTPVSFTYPQDAVSTRTFLVVSTGTVLSDLVVYPMLRVASSSPQFEPHVEHRLEFARTLQGVPVTAGGNYTDADGQQWICDEVDFERGVYVRRVHRVVLTGSEGWYLSAGNFGEAVRFDTNTTGLPKPMFTNVVCSHFRYLGVNKEPETAWVLDTDPYFRIITAKVKTPDDLKAWLAENNVTLLYAMKTPVETPLSESELSAYRALHSNHPNTTVLNDAGAHMAVTYVADTKTYIDNLIKEALS